LAIVVSDYFSAFPVYADPPGVIAQLSAQADDDSTVVSNQIGNYPGLRACVPPTTAVLDMS
jgi:hypothetical protein